MMFRDPQFAQSEIRPPNIYSSNGAPLVEASVEVEGGSASSAGPHRGADQAMEPAYPQSQEQQLEPT
jgi:hypothetical protein